MSVLVEQRLGMSMVVEKQHTLSVLVEQRFASSMVVEEQSIQHQKI
jgi:hypothetical protein